MFPATVRAMWLEQLEIKILSLITLHFEYGTQFSFEESPEKQPESAFSAFISVPILTV